MVDRRAGKARECLRAYRQLQWFRDLHRHVQELQARCGVSLCDGHAWEQLSIVRPRSRWKRQRNGRMFGTTSTTELPANVALTRIN